MVPGRPLLTLFESQATVVGLPASSANRLLTVPHPVCVTGYCYRDPCPAASTTPPATLRIVAPTCASSATRSLQTRWHPLSGTTRVSLVSLVAPHAYTIGEPTV